jgi:D-serine deaminase-like pyridoxal phosphate-dependent protein
MTRPNPPMPTLDDLPTPCLLLDRDRLARNLSRMQAIADRLGVALRPHLKTAKSVEVARLAVATGAKGLTVSTLKEAEYFAGHGFHDLFYAVSIVGRHVPRLLRLAQGGVAVQAGIDSAEAARQVVAAAGGTSLAFRIEIDCGEARGGLSPDTPELIEVAKLLTAAGHRITGVFTHAGHSYDVRDAAARRDIARQEQIAVIAAKARLVAAGFPCETVSCGSTPTATHAEPMPGVTELRAGVYQFGDLFQAGVGSHGLEDIAVSVLATVIRKRPEKNTLLIDAGAFALSKDRATAALGPALDAGFGRLADESGALIEPMLFVKHAFQEHGLVTSAAPIDYARFPLGSRVRVLPNHACATAAAHDRYRVVTGQTVVAEWERVNGW